jgi:hypothetical protein
LPSAHVKDDTFGDTCAYSVFLYILGVILGGTTHLRRERNAHDYEAKLGSEKGSSNKETEVGWQEGSENEKTESGGQKGGSDEKAKGCRRLLKLGD